MKKTEMVKYRGDGVRGYVRLLEEFAGMRLSELEEKMSPKEFLILKKAREIRSLLAANLSNPKDLAAIKIEIIEDLHRPVEEGGMGITNVNYPYRIISEIMSTLAEAQKMEKAVHRMVLDHRNQKAWEMAAEAKDLAAMNAADANYIKIHQLDTPDEAKLDPDSIAIQNLMATTRYSDVVAGADTTPPMQAIAAAEALATKGIIDLKEGRDFVMMDFEDLDDEKPKADVEPEM